MFASLVLLGPLTACEGFGPNAGAERCASGETRSCPCADGRQGAQSCLETGSYAACVCLEPLLDADAGSGCISGESQACACENGGAGAQICNERGTGFEACVCNNPFLRDGGMGCLAGLTIACLCEDGRRGAQTCLEDGATFGACQCANLDGGATTVCVPGRSEACICENGESGAQVCDETGSTFGECLCEEVVITQGCTPAQSVLCTCEDGAEGAQQCNAYGTGYGACICEEALTNCTPNASKSCACEDGRAGAQVCAEDGSAYSSCLCTGTFDADAGTLAQVCVPGAQQGCACINGDVGAQVCSSDGSRFLSCVCEADPQLCIPGQSSSCTCQNGQQGHQVCTSDGQSFGLCECDNIEQSCTPGQVSGCVCTDGRDGAQTCADDGLGYDPCVCENAEYNCVPNIQVVCACHDGRTGAQTCNEAGYAYSACICAEPPPNCTPNIQITCGCTDGRTGGQVCAADGSGYSSCLCADPGCVPGEAELCACTNGNTGAQVCNSQGDGWSVCDCPDFNFVCEGGVTQQCFCTDGRIGSQTCFENGLGFGACVCTEPPRICDPGYMKACACVTGYMGAQKCQSDGQGYEECICEPPEDAGIIAPPEPVDAGAYVDAGLEDPGPSGPVYAPRCTYNATRLCECPTGNFGEQTCNIHEPDGGILEAMDGSVPYGDPRWGECDCSEVVANGHPWLDSEFDNVVEVGPGKTYSEPVDVPWETFENNTNTLVKIHHRSSPYQNKLLLNYQATALKPFVVMGVPDIDGNLPIITGFEATSRSAQTDFQGQGTGVVIIGHSGATSDGPSYVVLDSLDIRDGKETENYTDTSGGTQPYEPYVAAVNIRSGHHITIRNCTIKNSEQGIITQIGTENVHIAHNLITNIGKVSSSDRHHLNVESIGVTYEYNHVGPPCLNCNGTLIKDRSVMPIVRYNFLQGGNRQVDLVESYNVGYAYHPDYQQAFVYGNLFYEDQTSLVSDSTEVLRYGGEYSNTMWYRKGDLYFYHNTVIYTRDGQNTVFNISTLEEKIHAHQNIFHTFANNSQLAMVAGDGNVDFVRNFITTGWVPYLDSEGAGLTTFTNNIEGDNPYIQDIITLDFSLAPGSPARNQGQELEWPMEELEFQYQAPQQRANRYSVGGVDLGALE